MGFAGYFEAVLYGDITVSTHPARHTPDMLSWWVQHKLALFSERLVFSGKLR